MKKKFRNIVVEGQKYGWQVKGSDTVWIWIGKKTILKTTSIVSPVTPKVVERIIRTEVLGETVPEDKYVLLRNHKHWNVFWTTRTQPLTEYHDEGFTVLFTGNDSESMVAEWQKYNPEPYLANVMQNLKDLGAEL